MTDSKNQHLYFIEVNKLLGINPNSSEVNSLPEIVIPNFIVNQLSVFLEKSNSLNKCNAYTDRNTAVIDRVSFSLKDVLESLLVAATAFTEAERKHALEMILISFEKVQESLLDSEMYDLVNLMDLAIEKIQLASKNNSIQEQDLFIAEILDVINEMNFDLDREQSSNYTLETVNMSHEHLQLNMSRFAAREISPNDL